jgi:hypothetical protein
MEEARRAQTAYYWEDSDEEEEEEDEEEDKIDMSALSNLEILQMYGIEVLRFCFHISDTICDMSISHLTKVRPTSCQRTRRSTKKRIARSPRKCRTLDVLGALSAQIVGAASHHLRAREVLDVWAA